MNLINIPADKSISHRCIIFASITKGISYIDNYLKSQDVLATIDVMKTLGAKITCEDNRLKISGIDLNELNGDYILDCKNSGTTARLLFGLLSGVSANITIVGDESLSKRPMKRVTSIFSHYGVKYSNLDLLPITFAGNTIDTITHKMELDSAQVKSAVILSSYFANKVSVTEKNYTRNHTELFLERNNQKIKIKDKNITVNKLNLLPIDSYIPGDISSASFFIIASLLLNKSIKMENILNNETRNGLINVLANIGANITFKQPNILACEKTVDIEVSETKSLKPFVVDRNEIATMIDEIPLLCLLASKCDGVSKIHGVEELKYKESNRIDNTINILKSANIDITLDKDTFVIKKSNIYGDVTLDPKGDHRMSMLISILNLLDNNIKNKDTDCQKVSFPDFLTELQKLNSN